MTHSKNEMPEGFVLLQREGGQPKFAACMVGRFAGWLMWKHPDGQWVSQRKLEQWELMQAEDQRDAGIIFESATPAGPEGDSEAEDEMVTFTVAGQSKGFLEQVRRELASKFPDGVAATEADSEAPDHGDTVLRVQKALGITDTGWVSPDVVLHYLSKAIARTTPAIGSIGDDAKFVALLDNYAQNGTDGYLLCLARIAAYVNRWADARSPVAAAPEEAVTKVASGYVAVMPKGEVAYGTRTPTASTPSALAQAAQVGALTDEEIVDIGIQVNAIEASENGGYFLPVTFARAILAKHAEKGGA